MVKKYYFPERLRKQLAKMQKYALTILEAPSGFGKTTAVREFLNTEVFQSTPVHWYTCLGESPQKTWIGICDLVGNVDAQTGTMLRNINVDTADSLSEIYSIIQNLSCDTTTYLIVDNFQLVNGKLPTMLLQALAHYATSNLRFVVLTQQMEIQQMYIFHNRSILDIGVEDFLFTKECVARYFRLSGVRINGEDLNRIYMHSAGWVVAIQLHLIHYQATGAVEQAYGVSELIENALWHKLKVEEQQFLVSVSFLEGFTLQQAALMIDKKKLPDGIIKLLRNNAFISYSKGEQFYSIHSILRDFLKVRFQLDCDRDLQKLIMKRTGDACLSVSDYYHAIQIFYNNEHYEAIFEMSLRDDYFNYDDDRYLLEWIGLVLKNCPVETLVKYPMSLVTFAFQFIFFGHIEEFVYLYGILGSIVQDPSSLSKSEMMQLQGEMAFVQSFTEFNDLEKMVEQYIIAYELLGGYTRFNLKESAWTFGGVSVLYMFWSKAGTLQQTIASMEGDLPFYTRLTRGHGTGGDAIIKAEALMMQGNDQDAEALCHKALYLARSKNQTSVCLCAELVLGRIAILRGDYEGYQLTVESIMKYLDAPFVDWQIKRMVELCIVTLAGIVGDKAPLPEWMYKVQNSSSEMFTAIQSYCHILYGKHLLLNKCYNELYGLSSPYLEMAQHMNFLLPQVYQYIYLASAKRAQGKNTEAKAYLEKALAIALPDEIYLPFAENALGLLSIFNDGSAMQSVGRMQLINVIALCNRQLDGTNSIIKAKSNIKKGLTPRELEIANLAKKGHAIKTIAKMLFISDETVKTILKSVYYKLDIHSKVELGNIDLKIYPK